jgi:SHS2 domain-containing protein
MHDAAGTAGSTRAAEADGESRAEDAQVEDAGFVAFEAVDHTADLAYIARGRSEEELFQNAAAGMMSFLIDPETIRPTEDDPITVEGQDTEECLISWLQELIYRVEVRGRLYREFRVEATGPPLVKAVARGESIDSSRHRLLTDIKAATYHDLHLRREETPSGPIYQVRIVLDI